MGKYDQFRGVEVGNGLGAFHPGGENHIAQHACARRQTFGGEGRMSGVGTTQLDEARGLIDQCLEAIRDDPWFTP